MIIINVQMNNMPPSAVVLSSGGYCTVLNAYKKSNKYYPPAEVFKFWMAKILFAYRV